MMRHIAKRVLVGVVIVFAAVSSMFFVANTVGDPAIASVSAGSSA